MLLTSRLAARAPKTLIIGGGGQLGPGLARVLRSSYGTENVILSDVRKANNPEARNGTFSILRFYQNVYLDLTKID